MRGGLHVCQARHALGAKQVELLHELLPKATTIAVLVDTNYQGSVAWWVADNCAVERAQKALRLHNMRPTDHDEPFAAIIRCTADPAKVDKRTRSKWSRVLRYALKYKSNSEPLDQFIKRKGGINKCASRFARLLGARR